MATQVLADKKLLPFQGRPAIRLIPKIQKTKKMTDYRPISLLNTDYKLLATVLAGSLRTTVSRTLCSHQKGGPGRSIFDSLCLFREIIDHAHRTSKTPTGKTNPVTAAIIAYDLEKAYDLVNREVL